MSRRKKVRTGLRDLFEEQGEIPSIDNFDALYRFFSTETFFDILEESAPPDEGQIEIPEEPRADLRSPAFEKRILQLAEQGDTAGINKLAQERLALSKPRGRKKMTKAGKWRDNPVHQATRIVEQVKFILEDLYPERRVEDINVVASEIAERAWNEQFPRKKVNAFTLRGQVKRSKKRRL